jgi:hypothetical protein
VVPAYGFTSRCVQKAALPFSIGCCQRHELNRASEADGGLSDVTGTVTSGVAAGAAAIPRVCSPGGLNVSLLELYANGFLQRAKRAQFFGSDEGQGTPG